ncbi:MAG: VWA domain-containing protein [Vicinamibacterales bacterium]
MRRAVVCAAAITAALTVMATHQVFAQRATFTSRLEAVRVDVSVTQRNRPVPGLTAADFEIFDNGVRQQVELVATDELPLDLVLALDMSGSVTGARFEHLRGASRAALAALTAGDKAGLITFSARVSLPAPLTSDLDRIRETRDLPDEQGTTSMIDAAYTALAHADAGSGRALAIVLSDGVDTSSWLTADSVVETAKRLDVVLFGISTGAPRRTPLEALADASGGDLIRIESTAQLSATLEQLIRAFRQRYLLSFVPQHVARGGWHKIEVRMKRRGLNAKARLGYFGS